MAYFKVGYLYQIKSVDDLKVFADDWGEGRDHLIANFIGTDPFEVLEVDEYPDGSADALCVKNSSGKIMHSDDIDYSYLFSPLTESQYFNELGEAKCASVADIQRAKCENENTEHNVFKQNVLTKLEQLISEIKAM